MNPKRIAFTIIAVLLLASYAWADNPQYSFRYTQPYSCSTQNAAGQMCIVGTSIFERPAPNPPSELHYRYYCFRDYHVLSEIGTKSYDDGMHVIPDYECVDPPQCPEDQFFDEESGECLLPPDLCYDDVVTGEQKCEPMWPDETPEQCVMDDGVMLCLPDVNDEYPEPEDPDAECLVVDGVYTCNTPDQVCGVKNGTYQCVTPQQEGCGYFNGERICFTPDGDPVPPDSPDHPDNGGNLDGNDSNDPTDSRPPEEGGDPERQPGYFPPTTDGNRASEQTAQDQLNALRGLQKTLNQIENNTSPGEMPSGTEGNIVNDLDGKGDSALEGVGDLVDSISDGEGPFAADDAGGIGETINGLLQPQGCTDLSFMTAKGGFEITCSDGQKIRDMLGFILYIFTLLALFHIVTKPPKGA